MSSNSCVVPKVEAFPYALALCAAGGASEVLLTGFDGFEPSDPRQTDMETLFRLYEAIPNSPPVTSLTRTSYPVRHSSIYAR